MLLLPFLGMGGFIRNKKRMLQNKCCVVKVYPMRVKKSLIEPSSAIEEIFKDTDIDFVNLIDNIV